MRKFYRTLVTLEVLSEYEPVPKDGSLDRLFYEITDGDYSGIILQQSYDEVSPQHMAEFAITQGSDPSFFGLDPKGNDVLEHELGLNLTVDHGHIYTDGDAKDGK